jgi:hypothetical protein
MSSIGGLWCDAQAFQHACLLTCADILGGQSMKFGIGIFPTDQSASPIEVAQAVRTSSHSLDVVEAGMVMEV